MLTFTCFTKLESYLRYFVKEKQNTFIDIFFSSTLSYFLFSLFTIEIVLTFFNDYLGEAMEGRALRRAKRQTIMQRIGTFMAMIPIGMQVIVSSSDTISIYEK